MKVLITGGAGYIGSHTALEMLAAGHEAVLLDNFSNASRRALSALAALTCRGVPFVEGDIRDVDLLDGLFEDGDFAAVVHLASLKAAGDSAAEPLCYYANNVGGTISLLQRMARHGVKRLVFSSSASIYGPASTPLTEESPTAPASPYGRTKLVVEELLRDLHVADSGWCISILRYFNAAGAHPSGLIGEDPSGTPRNLLPYIAQVAVGRRDRLEVFGDDYPTPDGTCIRDYLHVVDLARAHVQALDYLSVEPRLAVHNLGTGRGCSVLEVLRAFERSSGRSVPYRVVARRPGDAAVSFANPSRARDELGWSAARDIDRICVDLWRWQSSRPNGFGD